MKRDKWQFSFLLALALVASLTLIGCPSPTANDNTGDGDDGGSIGPTPVIFTDFETDLGGWAGNGGATVELSTEQVKNGAQACKVITGDAGWKSVWMYNLQDTILADVSYDYSVWVYQETGAEVLFTITLKDTDEEYNSVKYQVSIPSGVWTQVTSTYTLPAGKTAGSLYFETDINPTTFYFDDFKVIATPAS